MKNKSLNLLEVYCIASGAMISSGLFVLPAIVFSMAGPAILISYALAGLMVIPALFSKAELATAMPLSGGTYIYIDRSLGSLMGCFAGFANWFSISLKGAFALIGMGAFLQLIYPDINYAQLKLVAIALVILFTILNMSSVKESGHAQDFMVIILILILIFYIITGYSTVNTAHFTPFLQGPFGNIAAVAGMVFISYGGLTKVVSLAEEVNNPAKVLPKAMILSFISVNLLYLLTIALTIGILTPDEMTASLTPLSSAAFHSMGNTGMIILAIGALFSFATTANASILSASRLPVAMAKDGLLPEFLGKTYGKKKIHSISVLMTSAFMALVIVALDLKNLVKTASTMMLILFFLVNLSVILMRESRIISYKPKFKSPLYPFVQIIGMCSSILLISGMGSMPLILTASFFCLSSIWFFLYRGKNQQKHDSAIIRLVERVTSHEMRSNTLHEELTEILLERDEIEDDRFSFMVRNAVILDLKDDISKDELFILIAKEMAKRFELDESIILEKLHTREDESTTVIHPTLAIPHIVLDKKGFDMIIIRARKGVPFSSNEKVNMIFSLAGDNGERNFHLQALMAIAQIVQSQGFEKQWMAAKDEAELKSLILLADRKRL